MILIVSFIIVTILPIQSMLNINGRDINSFLFDSSNFDIIDLTYEFNRDTIYWPTMRRFEYTKIINGYDNGYWYAAKESCSAEHGGTHIDAPYHFNERGSFVADIPLSNLIVPIIIVDVESKVKDNPDFILYKSDLDYMINNNFGNLNKNCCLIFKYGWSKYYNNITRYLGNDGKSTEGLRFPGLSAEVAEWIVSSYKNVVGIGVDTASVDAGSSTSYDVHKILSSRGLYSIENVRLLDYVPESGCTGIILPMKTTHGTGAATRFVAICPKTIEKPFEPLY